MKIGTLARRLQVEIDTRGINAKELSTLAGLNETAVRDILKGRSRNPRSDTVEKLAAALGLNSWELLTETASVAPTPVKADQPPSYNGSLTVGIIPVAGEEFACIARYDAALSAGPGSILEAEPEPLDYHLVNLQWLRAVTMTAPERLAIVQVYGNSMEPTLFNGDWILVDTGNKRLSAQGIFALRIGDSVWVKRIQPMLSTGQYRLHSDNDRYDAEDVAEEALEPIGRVVTLLSRKM